MFCDLYLMYVLFGNWCYLIHPSSFAVFIRIHSLYHPLWILKSWLPQKTWDLGLTTSGKNPVYIPISPIFLGDQRIIPPKKTSKYGWLNMTTLFEKKNSHKKKKNIFEAPTRPWFHAHSTPPRALVVQWMDGKSKQQPYGWWIYPPE